MNAPECARCDAIAEHSCVDCDAPLCPDDVERMDEETGDAICERCDRKAREDHESRQYEARADNAEVMR